jgi:hypothetical protein
VGLRGHFAAGMNRRAAVIGDGVVTGRHPLLLDAKGLGEKRRIGRHEGALLSATVQTGPKDSIAFLISKAGRALHTRVMPCLPNLQHIAMTPVFDMNTPPPKGGGFKLRLKAGLVRPWRT